MQPAQAHKANQSTAFDWKEFGESVYFLFGERGLKERILFVQLRYGERAGPIVEAMIEGAAEGGRDASSKDNPIQRLGL